MSETSKENSEDNDSDHGVVENHVEELIQLQEDFESEEEDYDNDSSESLTEIAAEGFQNSEYENNDKLIAGELGDTNNEIDNSNMSEHCETLYNPFDHRCSEPPSPGELGTSPRGSIDDYDIRAEATSEDQARHIQMFNDSMRGSWGHYGHGVESLGSDGEASIYSAETEDEFVPHPWSGCSSPTHPSPRFY